MITASDRSQDASGGRRGNGWRLCTVQQVEDLKTLLGVLPVWSSGIFLRTLVGVKIAMVILQALAMDRSLGPRFKIPAGSMAVFTLVAFIAATPVLERAVFPLWRRVRGGALPPTPLQRVGLGHAVSISSMVGAALVERRRLGVVAGGAAGQVVASMSALWLLTPLGLVGVGEALYFPGGTAFYYQEFPRTLRGMAMAMSPLVIALGFYFSTVFVGVVRRVTAWLPADINQGRVDNVYWAVAVAATVNFGYFLVCVRLYKNRK
jgi:peptide/histidine transporter 3/4